MSSGVWARCVGAMTSVSTESPNFHTLPRIGLDKSAFTKHLRRINNLPGYGRGGYRCRAPQVDQAPIGPHASLVIARGSRYTHFTVNEIPSPCMTHMTSWSQRLGSSIYDVLKHPCVQALPKDGIGGGLHKEADTRRHFLASKNA